MENYLDLGQIILREGSIIQARIYNKNTQKTEIKIGKISSFESAPRNSSKNEDKIVVFNSLKKQYKIQAKYCLLLK